MRLRLLIERSPERLERELHPVLPVRRSQSLPAASLSVPAGLLYSVIAIIYVNSIIYKTGSPSRVTTLLADDIKVFVG